MNAGSILLVEDHGALAELFTHVLERAHYRVTVASNGEEAIAWMKKHAYDVVLTDIVMPGIDGLDVVSAARQHQSTARIVAFSGGSAARPADDCLLSAHARGSHEELRKPFTSEKLLAALRGTAMKP